MALRVGGAIGNRPLDFIWILDCSGSMSGEKIESLNDAIRRSIPAMREAARSNAEAHVRVRAVTFSSGAAWHIEEPIPIEEFRWQSVSADGETNLGKALALVAQALRMPPMEKRALPPVLVLVTDGQPTDPDWRTGLKAVLDEEWGRAAVRMAIAIGKDANRGVLQEFASADYVFEAMNAAALAEHIEFVSRSVGRTDGPRQNPGKDVADIRDAASSGDLSWGAHTAYRHNDEIVDPSDNTQAVIRGGISGGRQPVWAQGTGEETSDGTVVWKNLGVLRW